jgi:protein TonB
LEIVESRVLEALLAKNKPEPAPAVPATAPVAGNAAEDAQAVEKPEMPKKEVVAEKPPDKKPEAPPDPEPKILPDPKVDAVPDRETRTVNLEPPDKPAEPVPVEGPGEKTETPKAEENTVADNKTPEPPPKPEPPQEKPIPKEPPPEPKVREPPEQAKAEKKQRERPRRATRAGGVTSRAQSGDGNGAPRASASSGAVLGYAAAVRARVAGNKPSGDGQRGTAVISFGVTTSGRLAYASIARSSGNAALDRLALSAVRSAAPFPSPPAGATPAQLRFSIPFHFQ